MPELPEVETYARDLAGVLPGVTFTGAVIGWPNQIPGTTPAAFDSRLQGQRVESVGRRGKYIQMRLSEDWLHVHLKMSGSLALVDRGTPPDPHAHAVLLAGGHELRFRDPRKFGRLYLTATPEPIVGGLGPEPLEDELTEEAFAAALAVRRGRLKPLLLNQDFLAGLGNIYVDESLWLARLGPLRAASTVSRDQAAELLGSIRQVLSLAIERRGSTLTEGGFRTLEGGRGGMRPELKVFQRTGQPCLRCGATVARTVVGQRSTHYCPTCQT